MLVIPFIPPTVGIGSAGGLFLFLCRFQIRDNVTGKGGHRVGVSPRVSLALDLIDLERLHIARVCYDPFHFTHRKPSAKPSPRCSRIPDLSK